jgi:hypothetical protein
MNTIDGRTSRVLTLRTPMRSYLLDRMGLAVTDREWEAPNGAHTRAYFGDNPVNTTNMWRAPLYASKERKTPAPKVRSKAG